MRTILSNIRTLTNKSPFWLKKLENICHSKRSHQIQPWDILVEAHSDERNKLRHSWPSGSPNLPSVKPQTHLLEWPNSWLAYSDIPLLSWNLSPLSSTNGFWVSPLQPHGTSLLALSYETAPRTEDISWPPGAVILIRPVSRPIILLRHLCWWFGRGRGGGVSHRIYSIHLWL